MADPDATTCAACGASGELQEHHLVPRCNGGDALPTVKLCLPCHGAVHGRPFTTNHRELTKAGLRAAKARGVKLGNPQLRAGTPEAARLALLAKKHRADEKALVLLPFIERAQQAGCISRAAIARKLIEWGVNTPGGGSKWDTTVVRRVILRTVK